MRLIDGHALMESLQKATSNAIKPDFAKGLFEAQRLTINAPTIDAVEVVRCKDCKWSDWYKNLNGEHRCYCMEHGSLGHTDDDYCSYGERIGGDDNADE